MERLRNKILTLYKACVFILATAFFADATDLDDFIPNNFVFHSEAPSAESYNADFTPDFKSDAKSSDDNVRIASKSQSPVRVSYDLDSIYIEDSSTPDTQTKLENIERPYEIYEVLTPVKSLYIINCSLLI